MHWRRDALRCAVDPPSLALARLAECAPREVAVAAIDSALNLKLVTLDELARTFTDLLVGGRLVIELDGFEFHTRNAFEEDRRRDLVLLRLGYRVLRLSYRQLMGDWAAAESTILQLVRRGDHR